MLWPGVSWVQQVGWGRAGGRGAVHAALGQPGAAAAVCLQPIRDQYSGHVISLDQSEASIYDSWSAYQRPELPGQQTGDGAEEVEHDDGEGIPVTEIDNNKCDSFISD